MHLARNIKTYKSERSIELKDRVERAFTFSSEKVADSVKLYFYIQKYLLTKDEVAHQKIKELYKVHSDEIAELLIPVPIDFKLHYNKFSSRNTYPFQ